MNERSDEGDSLELASEIGLICKRMGPKNLDGSDVFSFDFYHQLILEYFAALQFNQVLETEGNQLQEWYSEYYPQDYFSGDYGPFFYFLRSKNQKLFECIVRENDWISQTAFVCL